MKRRRPRQHYRRVHTKKGLKKKLINKGVKPTITKSQRRIFKHLSNPTHHRNEYGGFIDFDKEGRIEDFHVIPGKEYEIDLPEDFEVTYHTHPNRKPNPPSGFDVLAILRDKKQQAEIVFRNGHAYILKKTPASKKFARKKDHEIVKYVDTLFYATKGKDWETKYKKALAKVGIEMEIDNNPNKPLKVDITPRE